jgi:hypothetical protein
MVNSPGGMVTKTEQPPLERDNWLQFFRRDCILEPCQRGLTRDTVAVTNTPIKVQASYSDLTCNLKPIPDSTRPLLLFLMLLSFTVFASNSTQRL